MLALSTAAVCTRWLEATVQSEAKWTAIDEAASPVKDSAQNGTTCRSVGLLPPSAHTQRRFSSKDGMVPTAVATTLDHAG